MYYNPNDMKPDDKIKFLSWYGNITMLILISKPSCYETVDLTYVGRWECDFKQHL